MALYYSEDGLPFLASPYSDEEKQEFEERLRRGGDITIISQRKCCDRIDAADQPKSQPQSRRSRWIILRHKLAQIWNALREYLYSSSPC